jgi:DNA-directed RNA polymerase specialized sigma24 family protein
MQDPHWPSEDPAGSSGFEPGFQTDWFAVHAAGRSTPETAGALEKLCRTYWYPLYAYVRRKGYDAHDAQDLTQEFFESLLETPWLRDVHQSKGRFRAFLLASFNNFLANDWRRSQTQKRGGGRQPFSLDALAAEEHYQYEPSHQETPDKVFDRRWAMVLLERVMAQLREEYLASNRVEIFEALKGPLVGEMNRDRYADLAGRLGTTEAALKKAAQRLRERQVELLRAEVAKTVNDPGEVDEEIHYLFGMLGD